MAGEFINIKSKHGSGYSGYLSLPQSGSGPGMLVVQEIFGVNSHIREVADLYAAAGFVALAPDAFWRAQPRVELGYTPDDIQKGMALVQKCGREEIVEDMLEAADALKALRQCTGKIGVVGYCMGGFIAFKLASRNAVDVAVGYYGGGISQSLDEAKNVRCPIMLHFGEKDNHIPMDEVNKIKDALRGQADASVFIYAGADHGFNCDQRPSYNRQAAMLAFGRSMVLCNRVLLEKTAVHK